MTDEKKEQTNPASPTQPDEPEVHLAGQEVDTSARPVQGAMGAEKCATHDFEWLGFVFPGEGEDQVFNLEALQPAD